MSICQALEVLMNASLSRKSAENGFAGDTGRTAVDKAMVILASLITSDVALSLTELSHHTRLAKATVHRVLTVLLAHGMIVRTGGKYSPGAMVHSDRKVEDVFIASLQQHSTPYLVDLHRLTGYTASVSILAGESTQHVNQIFGHRTPRLPSVASVSSQLTSTAIDLTLHAYAVEQDADYSRAPTTHLLSEIRRIGIAHVNDAVTRVTSIAVPLNWAQRPAALALTGHFKQVNTIIAARELRRAAFDLSRTLMAHRAINKPA